MFVKKIEKLATLQAKQHFCLMVSLQDKPALRVHQEGSITQAFKKMPMFVLGLAHCVLGFASLGDVGPYTHGFLRLSGPIAGRLLRI